MTAVSEDRTGASRGVDAPPVLLWAVDSRGRCLWCDDAWCAFVGSSPRDQQGDGWLQPLHPDDRVRCTATRSHSIAASAPYELEYRLRRHDGAYRSVVERAGPSSPAGPSGAAFVGAVADVTDVRAMRGDLTRRIARRAAAADLGRAALIGASFGTLADEATRLVSDALDTPYASVYERVDDATLKLRALVGLPDKYLGARVPIDESTSVGTAVVRRGPVVVSDWEVENRLGGRDAARRAGVRATGAMVLRSPTGPIGVLAVHAPTPRAFDGDDVNFLRTVANVLGAALARERVEEERAALLESVRATRDDLAATVGRLDTLLQHSPLAFAFVDRDYRFVQVNEPLAELDGVEVEAHLGHTIAEVLPQLWPRIEHRCRAVVETGASFGDLEIGGNVQSDGSVRYFSMSLYPVTAAGGEVLGMGALGVEISERKRAERSAALLTRAVEIIAGTSDVDTALQSAVEVAVPDFADSCHLYYEPAGEPLRVRIAHRDPAMRRRLLDAHERWPLDVTTMVAPDRAEPRLFAEVTSEMRREIATDAAQRSLIEAHGVESAIIAPLVAHGERLGLLVFNFTSQSGRRYESRDLETVALLADRLAEAVDAAGRRAAARRANERLRLLARAGELIAVELDTAARLRSFVSLPVPTFADVCLVNLIHDDGSFHMAAVEVADPDDPRWGTLADWRPMPSEMPSVSAVAVDRGAPVLLEDAGELIREFGRHRQALAARAGIESLLCVPLFDEGGAAFGTVTFAMAGSHRAFRPDDVEFADEFGRRAAASLRHARRYEQVHSTTELLQRSLLPRELPEVGGAEIAAAYIPATHGEPVGGDWYDAVPLTDGRLLVAIGDVAGHGVDVAWSTGRLRAALWLLALDLSEPSEIMRQLNRYVTTMDDADLATLAIARYDPKNHRVTLASAGHPPPLIVSRAGSRYCRHEPGLPLRVAHDAVYPTIVEQLEPGETLLLYTDGLIERRGEPLDAGMARLLAAANPDAHVAALTKSVTDTLLRGHAARDDIAVLALHNLDR